MPKLLVQDIDRMFLVDVRPDESVTVGRARDCEVPVETQKASRRHLVLEAADGGGHRVRDLASTNGSQLNGVLLEGEANLNHGDEILVGECRIVYHATP